MPFSKSTRRNAFPPLARHPPWWVISFNYETLPFGLKNRNHGCLTMSIYYFHCYFFCSKKDSEFLLGTMLPSCVCGAGLREPSKTGNLDPEKKIQDIKKMFHPVLVPRTCSFRMSVVETTTIKYNVVRLVKCALEFHTVGTN